MDTIEKQKQEGLKRSLPTFALLVGAFAAVKLAIHLLTATGYGYLCDELYAIDMSKHLAFGYVDLPPLVPALLAVNRALLGDSLFALHVLPALVGCATLVFLCLITRELGGRLFAVALLYKPIKAGPFPTTDFPPLLENRLGWDELAQTVASVYQGLPAGERAVTGIYADWFGPAGAINHYGRAYGLPPAVSGHLTYYLWGPGSSWQEMIIATLGIDRFRSFFEDIQVKAVFTNEHVSPISTRIGVFVCKRPKTSAKVIWAYLKMYK
ncbi:MAG: hypothetical protein ABSG21_10040 [Spirochaetia bacterium]|jgi:hypothetical protein